MRNDTNKLCIALCGPLPGVVEKLERRDDVEYTVFSNGCELFERIPTRLIRDSKQVFLPVSHFTYAKLKRVVLLEPYLFAEPLRERDTA